MTRSVRLIFALAAVAAALPALAALELGAPFTDGAVLQRDTPLRIWGRADAGSTVAVTFGEKSWTTTAGTDGAWRLTLPPMAASAEPRTLNVTSAAYADAEPNAALAVHDILVGEVWIVSGQSNMECPIWGENPRFRDGKGALMVSMTHLPDVRFVKNARAAAAEPKTVKATWLKFEPESFDYTKFEHRLPLSAIAFYFARELHAALGVPVGIVDSTWGGTGIDGWIPECGLAASDEPRVKALAASRRRGCQDPKTLWNAMVDAYAPMSFRAMAWYQGCANAGRDPELYAAKLKALRDGWAARFEKADLPIYIFQLAPYKQSWWDIWKAQEQYAASEPRAALVPLFDAGNYYDIHPNDKETAAQRLLAAALSREYGFAGIAPAPAAVKSWKIDGGKFALEFGGCHSLYVYTPDARPCAAFEVAGADGKWQPAVIDQYERPSKHFSRKITVSSAAVPEPKALRYCHARPFVGSLYGDNALPVAPFELIDPSYDKTTRESTLLPVPANADPEGWWMKRHAEKLAEIAANKDRRYDIVMLGDSITHFMESKPERGGEAYAQFTKDYKVLNLGYGGDRTENVIWRELNGELDGYRAKLFTVMIGTNNNDWGDSDPEHVSYGIRRVLMTIREKQPQAKILLVAITPRGKTAADPANQKNIRTNYAAKQLANGQSIVWLDVGDKFLGPDKNLKPGLTGDNLHPNEAGYRVFLDALRPAIEGLLK